MCNDILFSQTNHSHRKKAQKQQANFEQSAMYVDDYANYDFDEGYVEPLPPAHKCHEVVQLRGPYSPLEGTVYSIFVRAHSNMVKIDPLSVNSVLLENVPQDSIEKYVVGATVNRSDGRSSQLILRETTLLPNIRGFGPLMAMLFCPTMQLRRDKHKNRYVSVLTGLGYDNEKKRPLCEERDTVLNLDVVITVEDIEIVRMLSSSSLPNVLEYMYTLPYYRSISCATVWTRYSTRAQMSCSRPASMLERRIRFSSKSSS